MQNRNGPFHLISNRNFRNFGLNRKRPLFLEIEGNRFGQFLNTGYLKDQSELVKREKPRVSKSHLIG